MARTLTDGPEIYWDEATAGQVIARRRTNTVVVNSSADLPTAADGVHTLAADTYYEFNGTITSASALKYSAGSMVGGVHMGKDIFVYTGAGAALRTTNVNFYLYNLTVVAASGSAFDLTGTTSNEFFLEKGNFYGCASLGTISGYRVPTIIKTNFENYTTGLTFTGESEKILVDSSPFRGAAASAKSILFDDACVTKIIDLTGNYFKDHGAGAVGISVDAAATISDFAIARGNAFDAITTPLEGFTPSNVEWDFFGNTGVRNSRTLGEVTMDGNATATVLAVNTWTKIAGTTVEGYVERFDMTANNRLAYTGRRTTQVMVMASLSVTGSANGQGVQFGIYKNGAQVSPTMTTVLTGPTGARADAVSLSASTEMATDDYLEIWMRCTSGSDNATIESLQIMATG